jgi:t-SNARE complex subunit (syntaxin)
MLEQECEAREKELKKYELTMQEFWAPLKD